MRPSEVRALLQLRRPELRPSRRAVARSATIDDLRAEACRRWPRGVRDYVEGGADAEVSLRRNREAFEAFDLVPSTLRDVSGVDTRAQLLGSSSSMPFALAPTGYTRMMHADGEPAVARAARAAGVPYTLSTFATTSIEDVAAQAGGDLWFQLYVWRDRGLVTDLLQRAAAQGYRALMLTVDTAVTGLRARDVRNGFTVPPRLTLGAVSDMARHPVWCARMLAGAPITFANLATRAGQDTEDIFAYASGQLDPSVTWDDLAFVRDRWHGPLVAKGLVSPQDALRAAAAGVDAVVLSNHGGRQLDQVVPPVEMLPAVRQAVGDRIQVLVDSGIRRGTDVVTSVALGADGCLVGRPYLYGLGAAGEDGVRHALALLAGEVRRAMQLLGVTSIDELRAEGPRLVRRRVTRAVDEAERPASSRPS
jgi:L-lactate dehydrogenase (cytochrome)